LRGISRQTGAALGEAIAGAAIGARAREQERVNKVAAKEEFRNFGDWYRAKVAELERMKGREAIGMPERFARDFEEEAARRMEGVSDPTMRQVLADIQGQFREQGLNWPASTRAGRSTAGNRAFIRPTRLRSWPWWPGTRTSCNGGS
jgi:hypothetical protein